MCNIFGLYRRMRTIPAFFSETCTTFYSREQNAAHDPKPTLNGARRECLSASSAPSGFTRRRARAVDITQPGRPSPSSAAVGLGSIMRMNLLPQSLRPALLWQENRGRGGGGTREEDSNSCVSVTICLQNKKKTFL